MHIIGPIIPQVNSLGQERKGGHWYNPAAPHESPAKSRRTLVKTGLKMGEVAASYAHHSAPGPLVPGR